MSASPATLARLARGMLDDPSPPTRGLWARSAALLARQALEGAIREHFLAHAPAVVAAPFSTQLVCLREYTSATDTAARAAGTWAALSDACHHRGYGAPPTASELRGWLANVDEVLIALGAA